MNATATAQTGRFHGHLDTELVRRPDADVTKGTKYVIIQERDVSYRFYLHQHPFVRQLAQRLLRKGTSGLLAADTEYAPDGASLPGSVEIALDGNTALTVPVGARISLLTQQQATSGGAAVVLEANVQCRLAGAAPARPPDGMQATLADGMTRTPPAGAVFTPPPNSTAVVSGDTLIVLTAAAPVTLPGGTAATIPAGTEVLLAGGTQLAVPNGTQVTLLRSKPLPVLHAEVFSATRYNPSELVRRPYPVKDLDFTAAGAYAVYNWEVFFHVPLAIAIHLSKNQRFAEAQRWFHTLFDPTDDSDGPTPERFWKVRPFQSTDVKKIEEILVNLATGGDEALRNETIRSIEAWMEAPFRPHVIARYRQQAYMYKTVMAYLDNLIAWGDSLFRQDTGEAIDEALMVYVLAANILGPRPQPVPKKGAVRPQTYANLRQDLDLFGTVMRDLEANAPFDLMPFPAENAGDNARLATLRSLGKALYFCVPRNDKLLGYWDTVADRLFKIRNSLNIQGVFRQLPLFEPPIDPALLARAAAAGLDVGAIVNGLNQPLPLVRFPFLVQKAAEIVQEVKSLGNNLLAAMEKEDGEALALLRARHERVVMEMVEHVKYGQLQEAIKAREGLLESLALAVQRYTYYGRLLGKQGNELQIPALDALDRDALEKMKFSSSEPKMRLQEDSLLKGLIIAQIPGVPMNAWEVGELAMLTLAHLAQIGAVALESTAAMLGLIPEFQGRVTPIGLGGGITYGGKALSTAASFGARSFTAVAADLNFLGNMSAKIGSYARRAQDWEFQSNLAAGEITQIFKQLRAAEIRQAVAELELKNHRQQMKHAEEIEQFLNADGTEKNGKKTNKALYSWMKREVKGLYSQCFQFAFDIARKAERALQHELGNPAISYLQFGYLAGKEGLLAGEKLHLDVKRMEMAYHDLNRREYELTKHVSLLQVDPLALVRLRTTGRCTVRLPEALFDMDGPGHYFRRIKTVAVSIPCVTGPYASVNCTLTLLKSSIRKSPILRNGRYAREDAEDDRFDDYFGSTQSIVTSSAQNDSGMFETNLRDERYLPFENAGADSEWQLELPANPATGDPCQFDYGTISDVILHVRYTAREGGGLLRKSAADQFKQLVKDAQAIGCMRLFSVRHEFPTEWAKFTSQTPGVNQHAELALRLRPEHYPFWSQGRLKSVKRVDVLAQPRVPIPGGIEIADKPKADPTAKKDRLEPNDPTLGKLLIGKLANVGLPPAPADVDLRLFFDNNALSELWIAVTWGE